MYVEGRDKRFTYVESVPISVSCLKFSLVYLVSFVRSCSSSNVCRREGEGGRGVKEREEGGEGEGGRGEGEGGREGEGEGGKGEGEKGRGGGEKEVRSKGVRQNPHRLFQVTAEGFCSLLILRSSVFVLPARIKSYPTLS